MRGEGRGTYKVVTVDGLASGPGTVAPVVRNERKEAINGAEYLGLVRGSWSVFAGRRELMCLKEEGMQREQQNG